MKARWDQSTEKREAVFLSLLRCQGLISGTGLTWPCASFHPDIFAFVGESTIMGFWHDGHWINPLRLISDLFPISSSRIYQSGLSLRRIGNNDLRASWYILVVSLPCRADVMWCYTQARTADEPPIISSWSWQKTRIAWSWLEWNWRPPRKAGALITESAALKTRALHWIKENIRPDQAIMDSWWELMREIVIAQFPGLMTRNGLAQFDGFVLISFVDS